MRKNGPFFFPSVLRLYKESFPIFFVVLTTFLAFYVLPNPSFSPLQSQYVIVQSFCAFTCCCYGCPLLHKNHFSRAPKSYWPKRVAGMECLLWFQRFVVQNPKKKLGIIEMELFFLLIFLCWIVFNATKTSLFRNLTHLIAGIIPILCLTVRMLKNAVWDVFGQKFFFEKNRPPKQGAYKLHKGSESSNNLKSNNWRCKNPV